MDRPRVEEHHLDVEQDKEHRDQIELHREARVCVAGGLDAALVRRVLDLVSGRVLAQDRGDQQLDAPHADGKQQQHEYRKVIHGPVVGANCG